MSEYEVTNEQMEYMKRLARRLIQWRKSASIDADDLISAASMRWWQFLMRNPDLKNDNAVTDLIFRQQVKFAMRDQIRDSSPVKVTRTYQAKLQAYQQHYTVDIESTLDIRAGDDFEYTDELIDVLSSIQKLPERDQIILSLSIDQGYSFTEIAYVLDVSVSTVTRAYQKSIDILKKNLHDLQIARKN